MEGRSRYEMSWEMVTTVFQLHQILEESRRIRLAFLETWPSEPHLDVIQEMPFGQFNAVSRFMIGLYHEDSHLEHLREIMRQAQADSSAPVEYLLELAAAPIRGPVLSYGAKETTLSRSGSL